MLIKELSNIEIYPVIDILKLYVTLPDSDHKLLLIKVIKVLSDGLNSVSYTHLDVYKRQFI